MHKSNKRVDTQLTICKDFHFMHTESKTNNSYTKSQLELYYDVINSKDSAKFFKQNFYL